MKVTQYLAPPIDATGEGPHTSVFIRSSNPLLLCSDVENETLRCLPSMQNSQRSSLQDFIPDSAPFLCRSCRPLSLMCPRCICHSLVVSSSSVETEASPAICFRSS